jgi:prephenate dehydrogenase
VKVAILGSGLIGGSIGLAIKQRSPETEVVAYDLDPASAARAVDRGAADASAASAAEAAAGSDVIFIATPVGVISAVAGDIGSSLKPGSVVTDVGSTKSRVVVEVEGSLPEGVSFIGGHPMAGTEDEGIEAATPDLFENAWWILTPTDRSDPDAYKLVHGLLATLGARVMALKPGAHDELMAVVSHVPHLTAAALMNMAADRGRDHAGLLALAAGGFRDVTRVAASNPEIWLDICDENRDAIATALEGFAGRLLELRDLVKRQDRGSLRDVFLAARESRRNLPGKQVEGDLFEVRMPVPDRPGVLAEVTTTVGNLGINVEDLQLTHAAEGGRGTLHLSIIGRAEAEHTATVLRGLGFDAKAVSL